LRLCLGTFSISIETKKKSTASRLCSIASLCSPPCRCVLYPVAVLYTHSSSPPHCRALHPCQWAICMVIAVVVGVPFCGEVVSPCHGLGHGIGRYPGIGNRSQILRLSSYFILVMHRLGLPFYGSPMAPSLCPRFQQAKMNHDLRFVFVTHHWGLPCPPPLWFLPPFFTHPSVKLTFITLGGVQLLRQAAHIPLGRGGAIVGILSELGALAIGPTSLKRGEGHHVV